MMGDNGEGTAWLNAMSVYSQGRKKISNLELYQENALTTVKYLSD